MQGLDLDLVTRLKFCKARKEEGIKGKGLVYSWEVLSRQPTNNGFVIIIQKWGQMLQHDYRIVVVRATDERICVPIVESCSESDSKLGATLIAHVVETLKTSMEGDLWERLAGWWIEQQATKVISRLKDEAAGYGTKGSLNKTTFAALAQKQNEILSQQELKSVTTPVAAPSVTKPEDLFQFKTKSGWLYKEGSKWKTWKKRWFRLTHHLLVYYNDMVEEDKALDLKLIAGIIELQDCTLRETTRKESGKPVFELYHVHRSLFMYAETEEDRVEWMEAFRVNCQYKEGIFNRFEQSAQEAELRGLNVQKELEEARKSLEELQAKTFLEEVHAKERMAEVKRKEKELEELVTLKAKLKETEEDYLQQKDIVVGLRTDNQKLKTECEAAQTNSLALVLQIEQLKAKANVKEEPTLTMHVSENKSSAQEKELEAALQAALAQVFELKEQKKVLVKEVKRLTKT